MASPSRRRTISAAATLPTITEMRSRAPLSAGTNSTRSGSTSAAAFSNGGGSSLVIPFSELSTTTRCTPCRRVTSATYGAEPLSERRRG
jgi:hypothetical protein